MGIFFHSTNVGHVPQRTELMRKYEIARSNLIFAIAMTAINIFAPLFGADFYFMFSLFTPTAITGMGSLFCGMYPDEVYAEAGLEGMIFLDESYYYAFLAAAVIVTLVFLLCWFMSKGQRVGWLIAATALFTADSLLIFVFGSPINYLFDLLFHAWVLYLLISGIVAHFKLKALPAEGDTADGNGEENEFDNSYGFDNADGGADSGEKVYDSVLDAFMNPDPKNKK